MQKDTPPREKEVAFLVYFFQSIDQREKAWVQSQDLKYKILK